MRSHPTAPSAAAASSHTNSTARLSGGGRFSTATPSRFFDGFRRLLRLARPGLPGGLSILGLLNSPINKVIHVDNVCVTNARASCFGPGDRVSHTVHPSRNCSRSLLGSNARTAQEVGDCLVESPASDKACYPEHFYVNSLAATLVTRKCGLTFKT